MAGVGVTRREGKTTITLWVSTMRVAVVNDASRANSVKVGARCCPAVLPAGSCLWGGDGTRWAAVPTNAMRIPSVGGGWRTGGRRRGVGDGARRRGWETGCGCAGRWS